MPLSLVWANPAKRCMLAGPQYIWGPSGSKLLFTGLLIDMLCMDGGALADDVASGAPIYERESAHLPVACMGFKHVVGDGVPFW